MINLYEKELERKNHYIWMEIMNEVLDSFSHFINAIETETQNIGRIAAIDWHTTLKRGSLNQFIVETIRGIKVKYSSILSDSQRNSTIISLFYEIITSKTIKHFLESLPGNDFSIKLDSPLSSNKLPSNSHPKYPDILVKKNNNVIGIIELKYYLKNSGYPNEKERMEYFTKTYPCYVLLQFWSHELDYIESLLNDNCDWIFIINPNKQIKQINNSKRKFTDEEEKKKALAKLKLHNALELALERFIIYES